MDRQERINSFAPAISAAMQGLQASIWTAMPGIVVSYSPTTQSAEILIAIQPQVRNQQGTWKNVTIAVLPDVPVDWPGGGGACLTFPLQAGDEGIVVFGSRCINAWWSQGGVQPQEEFRMHNLSDGMFIPRLRSKPKVPVDISATQVQLRSDDGLAYIELDPAGHVVSIIAPGGINLNGVAIDTLGNMTLAGFLKWPNGEINGGVGADVQITGALTATGEITRGFGTGDSVTLGDHTHTQANDSHGDAEQPTSKPTAGT
jgi:hypothetical protein